MDDRNTIRKAAAERIARYLLATDLSRTSPRELARATGLNDRMFAYVFAGREDALGAALGLLCDGLQVRLQAVDPGATRRTTVDMMAEVRKVSETPAIRPYIALSIAILNAAGRGERPFVTLAARITNAFLDWIAGRLDIEDEETRRGTAGVIFTTLNPQMMGAILTGQRSAALKLADWS